jgi:hypothetical protein
VDQRGHRGPQRWHRVRAGRQHADRRAVGSGEQRRASGGAHRARGDRVEEPHSHRQAGPELCDRGVPGRLAAGCEEGQPGFEQVEGRALPGPDVGDPAAEVRAHLLLRWASRAAGVGRPRNRVLGDGPALGFIGVE